MRISLFSVDRPVAVTMMILGVLLLGFVSLTGLSIDLMPELDLPIAVVSTPYTGASPAEIESMVTRPLEESLATTSDLESMTSYSSAGNSLILVQFGWDTNMSDATLEMREMVDMVRDFLPEDAGSPTVLQIDPNMMPIMQFGMTGDRDIEEIKALAEDEIVYRLERIEGVASVSLTGGLDREIRVVTDPGRLEHYGITMSQMIQAIGADNMNMSAGFVEKGSRDLIIDVEGRFTDPGQIGDVLVYGETGAGIPISTLARIEDGFREAESVGFVNGRESIALSVSKQSGANTVAVARAVNQEVERLSSVLPEDIRIETFFDTSEYIQVVINAVAGNLLLGGLLAALVLFLFLRDIRSTLIVALSMPISVVATFVLMYFSNLTLNIMTLGGLALGVGMMVDNSIVVLENIFRHNQLGDPRMVAAKAGATEVSAAITASTLTTVAVFFPIAFTGGMTSQIFNELALTVSFALLASLFVAVTATPMLASRLIRADAYQRAGKGPIKSFLGWFHKGFERIVRVHGRFLRVALRNKKKMVALFVALFIGSLSLFPLVGQEFMPPTDEGQISMSVRLPRGTRLDETISMVEELEAFIQTIPEVEMISSLVGSSGGGFSLGGGGTERGDLYLLLSSERVRTTDEVVEEIRQYTTGIPGAEINVTAASSMEGGMGGGSAIQLLIKGPEMAVLEDLSGRISQVVGSVPGTREVSSSIDERRPELRIVVDREKARSYGLNAATVAQSARMAVGGQTATRFRTETQEVDVRVLLEDSARDNVQKIGSVQIPSPMGMTVPLREVAAIENVDSLNTITRQDQVRMVTVSADIFGIDLNRATSSIEEQVAAQVSLPEGYVVEFSGMAEQMEETFADLTLVVILAAILVYMILAAQFESLLYPFIVMFTLPFTLVGVFAALLVTGKTLNIVSFIGIIMLVGIVVNNAIVLIDYANKLKERGMSSEEAILEASAARLRPIVMTALTTMLAMVPIAVGIGNGGEMISPMGVVIIGGLLFATLITLILIPVIYRILDVLKERRTVRRQKKAEVVQ